MKKYKYLFYQYKNKEIPQNYLSSIKELLDEDWIYDTLNPQYIFSLGGDGTFLYTFNHFYNETIKLIGINTGTLGFYTAGSYEELKNNKNFLISLVSQENYFHPYILKAEFYDIQDNLLQTCVSLNDLVIQNPFTLKGKILVNDLEFLDYAGTGLIFSTPTGSTGINKSNNGPICFSSLNLFCLSFILPINNKKYLNITNPFLFDDKVEITWVINEGDQTWELICDGDFIRSNKLKQTKYIKIKLLKAKCEIFMNNSINNVLKRLKNCF